MKTVVNNWEIECFIQQASIYSSEDHVILVSNDQKVLAKVKLLEDNAIIDFTTVKTNVPAGIRVIQFLS